MTIIQFEGIDGSGKDSLKQLISSKLKQLNYKVETFNYPDKYNCITSELIREGLIEKRSMNKYTWECIIAANMYEVDERIQKSQADIKLVSRGQLSHMVYGIYAMGIEIDDDYILEDERWLYSLIKNLTIPDIVFYIDVIPDDAVKRLTTNELYETKPALMQTRELFKKYLMTKRIQLLDERFSKTTFIEVDNYNIFKSTEIIMEYLAELFIKNH